MEKLLEEQQKTNELLQQLIDKETRQNELLTIEQVHKEFDIGINKVRNMFNDPELPVQTYTVLFKVKRKAVEDYFNTRHDYLCEK